jgi:hypothetical protein
MNPHTRIAAILDRIVSAVGAHRTRADDAIRMQRNGTDCEQRERVEKAIARLEHVARELEDALT